MEKKVLLLRAVHTLFAIYFISCIFYIYYAVIVARFNLVLIIAIVSLIIEGVLVFILNGGDCPLIHIQKKLDDPIPFFNLFLPDHLAKKAIPFFTNVTFLGLILLVIRYFFYDI